MYYISVICNLAPLFSGQPHQPDVNHSIYFFLTQRSPELHNEVGSQSPAEHLVGFEPGIFQF